MSETTTQQIMNIIQRVYADASQTVLDQQCASEIVKHLRETGWFSPEDVRMVVAGAGGRVVIPVSVMVDPPKELLIGDCGLLDRVLITR